MATDIGTLLSSTEIKTIDQSIRVLADYQVSSTALIWRDYEYSFFDLDNRIDQVAYGLVKQGVVAGDRVAIYMHNTPHFIESYMAILRLGAIAVPLNIFYEGVDLEVLLNTCGAVGLITIEQYYFRVAEVRNNTRLLKWVVVITSPDSQQPVDTIPWETVTGEMLPLRLESSAYPDEPAVLTFTSGTGGVPKAVLLTHQALLNAAEAFATMRLSKFGLDSVGRNFSENVLLPLPLFNIFSLNIGLNMSFRYGATIILMEKFRAEVALDLMQRYRCTVLHGTPSIFRDIVYSPAFRVTDFSNLRRVYSFGDFLPEETVRQFRKQTHLPIFNCYGLAETAGVVASSAASPQLDTGSVGRLLPEVNPPKVEPGENYPPQMVLQIVDAEGAEVDDGYSGEVAIFGTNLNAIYFDLRQFEANRVSTGDEVEFYESVDVDSLSIRPDSTRFSVPFELRRYEEEGMTRRGIQLPGIRTGDMGFLDRTGNLRIFDRVENGLWIDGQYVYSRSIENFLLTHPDVIEAAAQPVEPDEGQPYFDAYVIPQLRANTGSFRAGGLVTNDRPEVTEQILLDFCKSNLPPYQQPRHIYFIEEMPRLVNGSILRRALRPPQEEG